MLRSLVKTAIEDTCTRYAVKLSEIQTKLQPHQQRVVDRLQQSDQPGLVVIHGLGSGKTLSSIAAQDALGLDATTVVPAALQAALAATAHATADVLAKEASRRSALPNARVSRSFRTTTEFAPRAINVNGTTTWSTPAVEFNVAITSERRNGIPSLELDKRY
jgi:N12 class adenine-specific DNA methylase